MPVIVFAGPSLGTPDPLAAQRIEFHPPAHCGDITRAVCAGAAVIGLIDGVFETAASVWHKELVYALAHGTVVFGAASMGALRAAELEPFGMIGIGAIFRAYRDGTLEDDDEVAVQHGPTELAYLPLTEAMVNVRATLDAAMHAGVVAAGEQAIVCRVAKSLFYKHRTWQSIVAAAAAAGMAKQVLRRFAQWRAANTIDVKRRDAQLLIDAMLNPCPALPACGLRPVMSRTTYWLDHEDQIAPAGSRRRR